MATPTFTLGGNTLLFPQGIQLPSNTPRTKIQVEDRTSGGTLQIEDLGVGFQRLILNFRGLLKAKYVELEAWFEDIADGKANTFTYENEIGSSFTVRLMTNPLDFIENRNGFLDGDLELEVIP